MASLTRPKSRCCCIAEVFCRCVLAPIRKHKPQRLHTSPHRDSLWVCGVALPLLLAITQMKSFLCKIKSHTENGSYRKWRRCCPMALMPKPHGDLVWLSARWRCQHWIWPNGFWQDSHFYRVQGDTEWEVDHMGMLINCKLLEYEASVIETCQGFLSSEGSSCSTTTLIEVPIHQFIPNFYSYSGSILWDATLVISHWCMTLQTLNFEVILWLGSQMAVTSFHSWLEVVEGSWLLRIEEPLSSSSITSLSFTFHILVLFWCRNELWAESERSLHWPSVLKPEFITLCYSVMPWRCERQGI